MSDGSRRAFLGRMAALGVAGVAAPFAASLAAIGEAAAATSADYRALVCVFLYGGNDWANTLVPYDQDSYTAYQAARPKLAISRDALGATVLSPTTALPGGRQFALAPGLAPLMGLFSAGRLAPVLNLGTLVQPTTKQQFQSGTKLPPKLFSHNDQQSYFQASNPEGATSGWGGRIGDLFQSGNGSATLTCCNAGGNAVFLTGRSAVQYAVGTNGPVPLAGGNGFFGTSGGGVLTSLMTGSESHPIMAEHARISKRALDTYSLLSGALAGSPAPGGFPAGNPLAAQLAMVARMIGASGSLGERRQVFMVSMGGFDLHDGLVAQHPQLMAQLAGALVAFDQTMQVMGVGDKVTTFTASDFGRTLTANDDGSDHGWGGMHFVMGGAVKGNAIYGKAPVIAVGGPDDVGQGRLLPSTAVDQYASTLASWFGVSDSDMSTVLPNIANYDASTRKLGFLG